jgi:antitoxin component of MazEF toxin-antitoxin module
MKRVTRIGNSWGVILDRPLLQQADIEVDANTELEVTVEDHAIVLRAHRNATDAEAWGAVRSVIQKRRKLMQRLAK